MVSIGSFIFLLIGTLVILVNNFHPGGHYCPQYYYINNYTDILIHIIKYENINIEQVATGEHWLATNAISMGLVDKLQTSDDYLMSQLDTFQLISLKAPHKTKLIDKIFNGASNRLSAWIM